jgi:5'-nucleotidase
MVVTVELSGADILAALEHGVSGYPEPVGEFIQVSGLGFAFDPGAAPGRRVTAVTMADGKPLDAAGVYTVATIDFIAAGGDGYAMMQNGKNLKYYGGDAEALTAYLKTSPEIYSDGLGGGFNHADNGAHLVAVEPELFAAA